MFQITVRGLPQRMLRHIQREGFGKYREDPPYGTAAGLLGVAMYAIDDVVIITGNGYNNPVGNGNDSAKA